jgi:hypothetical protein
VPEGQEADVLHTAITRVGGSGIPARPGTPVGPAE